VDECFGRVLDTLDRLHLADNTIIVFNSDNGGNTHSNTGEDAKALKRKPDDPFLTDWRKWAGLQPPTVNTPLRDGKGTLYEGGTRVPLMWSWSGRIQPGTTSDAVVGHIDLYPTLLDLLGLPRPAEQKLDGVSYAAVLRQTGTLDRQAFFNYFPHGASTGRAGGVWVRAGDWKLIRWFGVPAGDENRSELYNLRDDLSERPTWPPPKLRVKGTRRAHRPLPRRHRGIRVEPAYQPNAVRRRARDDPLDGWKAPVAVVKDGVLTMTGRQARHRVPPGTGWAN
jgi:arylsulfatase A-like enzyme